MLDFDGQPQRPAIPELPHRLWEVALGGEAMDATAREAVAPGDLGAIYDPAGGREDPPRGVRDLQLIVAVGHEHAARGGRGEASSGGRVADGGGRPAT